MKNLILIWSLLVISISAFAQDRYISLQECNNDTLEYVKANFTGKKIEKYINKPFGIFADDFELDFHLVVTSVISIKSPREVEAIKISYKDDGKFHLKKKFPLYCCFVQFHQPYPSMGGFITHKDKNRINNNTAIREYFGNFIIKDIEFVLLFSNGDTSKDKFWYWKDLGFD